MDSGFVSLPSAAAAAAAVPVATTTAIAAADITTVMAAAATTGLLTIGDPESRLAAREALKAKFRQDILAELAGQHPPPPHQPTETETAIGQWRCDLCEMSMTSEAQFTEHLEGVKHRDLCEKSMAREAPFTESVQFVEQQAKEEKGSGFFCDLCQMGMTGEATFQAHLKGKKHRNKAVVGSEPMPGMKRKAKSGDEPAGAFNCDLCQMGMTGEETFQAHLKGKKHRNKAVVGSEPMSGMKRQAKSGDEPAGSFNCALCQVSTTSAELLLLHLKGKKHQTKKDLGTVSTFECWICGVQCTAQSSLDAHLTGKKHKAMVEKSQKNRQEATASTTDTKMCGKVL